MSMYENMKRQTSQLKRELKSLRTGRDKLHRELQKAKEEVEHLQRKARDYDFAVKQKEEKIKEAERLKNRLGRIK